MSVAALLGAGLTLTTQAGVQSVIVATLVPQSGQAFTRWLDAVVGGSVALLFTVFAPAARSGAHANKRPLVFVR